MIIKEITDFLEGLAPLSLQEDYDNAGLLIGEAGWECRGVLCALDATEQVIGEALALGCNCVVVHHPVIFRGLKKINAKTYTGRTVIKAIRNDVAIYAAHTNLDNIVSGVNDRIADRLGLKDRRILSPKRGLLKKLYTYAPVAHTEAVKNALFAAGAGDIGSYSECSFSGAGTGTFKPGAGTSPFSGTQGQRQSEEEMKIEVILPAYRERAILRALFASHPYEEVAYEVVSLDNDFQDAGSGLTGNLPPTSEADFLQLLAVQFGTGVVRYSGSNGRPIKKVAVCGGAGSFLISKALEAGADAYVTADLKYHEFFDAEGTMLLCDIGHYESEQFTVDLFVERLAEKFPTFAVLKSKVRTNPVNYFSGK